MLNNSIRLRLAQDEVTNLATGQAIVGTVPFPNGSSWTYQLIAKSQEMLFDAELLDHGISISLSKAGTTALQAPDLVGHTGELATPNGPLKILVEKDFKCLTPRNEDESGLFENPNTQC